MPAVSTPGNRLHPANDLLPLRYSRSGLLPVVEVQSDRCGPRRLQSPDPHPAPAGSSAAASPAPTSSTHASAISATTSVDRNPSCFRPALAPCPESFSASCKFPLAIRSAGISPNRTAAATAIATVHATASPSMRTLLEQRQRDRSLVRQKPRHPQRNRQPHHRSSPRQNQALRQQLPHQPPAVRAQRAPHREFLAPRRCPRQQQVRQVHAHNQQNHSHRAPQHDQRPPQLAAHIILQPNQLPRVVR